jgi:hypothetical protein
MSLHHIFPLFFKGKRLLRERERERVVVGEYNKGFEIGLPCCCDAGGVRV